MKKWLLIACMVLMLGTANAQTSSPDLSFRFGVNLLIVPSVGFALEARESRGGLGVRSKLFYFVEVYGYSLDAYVFLPVSPLWDVYLGAGLLRMLSVLPFVGSAEFTYGLLGVRLRDGFFLELTPGIVTTRCAAQPNPVVVQPCVSSPVFAILGAIGFAWRI